MLRNVHHDENGTEKRPLVGNEDGIETIKEHLKTTPEDEGGIRLWMLVTASLVLSLILHCANLSVNSHVHKFDPASIGKKIREVGENVGHVLDGADKSEKERNPGGNSITPARSNPIPPADPSVPLIFPELPGFKDMKSPLTPNDHAVFWHIPKSGGTSVKEILGSCFHFVMACELGIRGHEQDKELKVVKDEGGSLYVNVDTTTLPGIIKAKKLNFAQSHLAKVTSTSLLYDIETLFSPNDVSGRVFTMLRHPVGRAVSLFSYLQYADWEPTYNPALSKMSLEEYAKSEYIENNFLTRSLSNTMEGGLNEGHLRIAKDVLQRKVLVGFMGDIDGSMSRFEKYFGWKYTVNPTEQESCREGLVSIGTNINKKKIQTPEEGSEAYELLAWQNLLDIELYEFAKGLFKEQEVLVKEKPDDFRLVDATCSACEENGRKFLR